MNKTETQAIAPIARARLGLHPSHRRAALEAAARCTAGWPSPEEFDRGTADLIFRPELGMWVRPARVDTGEDLTPDEAAQKQEREAWHQLDRAKRLRRASRMRSQALAYAAQQRRMDSSDADAPPRRKRRGVPFAYAVIHRDGEDPEVVESGFRFDGAVANNSRVADAAVHVLQAMKALAASWDQMDPQTRASAQVAVGASRRFLQAAGIRSVAA